MTYAGEALPKMPGASVMRAVLLILGIRSEYGEEG
jgi:hypothetical protein